LGSNGGERLAGLQCAGRVVDDICGFAEGCALEERKQEKLAMSASNQSMSLPN